MVEVFCSDMTFEVDHDLRVWADSPVSDFIRDQVRHMGARALLDSRARLSYEQRQHISAVLSADRPKPITTASMSRRLATVIGPS